MRAEAVDWTRVLTFLRRLGGRVSVAAPVELFLAGSAGLILAGVRASVDLEFTFRTDARAEGPFLETLRQVAREVGVAVEIAPLDHFISLPGGWRERSPSVGRFGRVDVCEFDPYSVALSKLERGHEQDLQDVADAIRLGRVDLARLQEFAAWLPERYAAGPWSFRRGEDADSTRARLAAGLARVSAYLATEGAERVPPPACRGGEERT